MGNHWGNFFPEKTILWSPTFSIPRLVTDATVYTWNSTICTCIGSYDTQRNLFCMECIDFILCIVLHITIIIKLVNWSIIHNCPKYIQSQFLQQQIKDIYFWIFHCNICALFILKCYISLSKLSNLLSLKRSTQLISNIR